MCLFNCKCCRHESIYPDFAFGVGPHFRCADCGVRRYSFPLQKRTIQSPNEEINPYPYYGYIVKPKLTKKQQKEKEEKRKQEEAIKHEQRKKVTKEYQASLLIIWGLFIVALGIIGFQKTIFPFILIPFILSYSSTMIWVMRQ